jgi:hypothetical protein
MEFSINENENENENVEFNYKEEDNDDLNEVVVNEVLKELDEAVVKEEEDCVELKNIKYKTMMLNGVPLTTSKISANNMDNLDKFLESEKNSNINDSWSNLDKTVKIKKLTIFAEGYKTENSLSTEEYDELIKFLKEALDHKKIQRVKDVVYDKITGLIKSIPALAHNKSTNRYTLKNTDKRISTLKSLPPKKTAQKTAKNPLFPLFQKSGAKNPLF